MPAETTLSMRALHWPAVFAAILASWAALYVMSVPADLRETSRVFGGEFWAALCTVTPDAAGYLRGVLMWALMSTAMMLPTLLGALATYDDIGRLDTRTRPLTLVMGYLTVWWGFSALAAAAQLALVRADLVSQFGDSRSAALSAILLAGAGVYQFTPLKHACLTKCRRPLAFFLAHWSAGPWRMGLRLGIACMGCCWALMLLAFVGGVMSLAFMGIATLIMTLEKMPEIGRWLSKPLGAALLGAGGWVALAG